jgi:triacylglycerol esterase/lipase EstA (alpha/beta hydrolase family)
MKASTLLRLWLTATFVIGTLLAAWLLPAQARGWAWAVGVLLPFALAAVVLAIEFLLAAALDPRAPRATAAHVLAVYAREVGVSWRMFLFEQPFRATFPEPPIERDPHRPAVLLVHGYLCNRAVWRPLLASRALAHCNVATVNLQPVFAPIDAYADAIASAVQRLRAASGAARVVLIGHSMGGIAIRAYLRKHGDEHVARAITIGSPHAGTVLGRLGHGVNARQMARGGAYMAALQAALTAAPRAKFVCLASRDDNMIIPRASALIPGTRHVVFDRVGHLAMVEDARVWRALAELVETAAA